MTRPLETDLVAGSSDRAPAVTSNGRLRVTYLAPQRWWSLLRRWRKGGTEVALAFPEAFDAARVAGAVSGVPVIEMPPDGSLDEIERRAAVRAARPGAGLEGKTAVSVVVPVLNDAPALDGLLSRLKGQLRSDDEIIVVDGGSNDGTTEVAERYSDSGVRLLHRPGTNIPAARNAGVREARRDVIALTDAGCTPAEDWLDAIRAAFAEVPRPGLVTGVYRVAAQDSWEHAMAIACYPAVEEAGRAGLLARSFAFLFGRGFDPTTPTGRSAAVDVAAWRAVGGMPEHLDTAEDVTFGRAIAEAGYECLLSRDAEVVWEQRPTIRSTARMYYRYGVGGGLSDDRLVIGRDLTRALAYIVVPVLFLSRGTPTRMLIVGLGLLYLSLPLARAARRPDPVVVGALTIPALVLKDLSKAAGCIVGLLRRARTS